MKTFGAWQSWDDVRIAMTSRLSTEQLDRLAAAHAFADARHAGQTRPAGEPYVRHLLEVTEILGTELNVADPDLLAAGLLHDVVEDTPTAPTEVANRFGQRVAVFVDQVTMPPPVEGEDRDDARHRYLNGLRDLPADALKLKLADRYSNVQRLHTYPRPDKQHTYYAETCRYLVPLAGVDPRLATLFADWERAYRHLRAVPS